MWFNTGDCAHEPHIRKLVAVGTAGDGHPGRAGDGQGLALRRRARLQRDGAQRVPHHAHDRQRSLRAVHRQAVPVRRGRGAELDRRRTAGRQGRPPRLPSPSVSPGYWNDSVNTYRFRLNGWFLTGDLVYRDDDRPLLPPRPGPGRGRRVRRAAAVHLDVRGAHPRGPARRRRLHGDHRARGRRVRRRRAARADRPTPSGRWTAPRRCRRPSVRKSPRRSAGSAWSARTTYRSR